VNHKLDAYGDTILTIAQDAARLKELEMVAERVMRNDAARVRPDGKDAENLRKLLLSETRDWRGLAIRSAACLFRLRALSELTPESIRCSREALLIYAPLASRLGMHRLKSELEGTAFQILYRRQYAKVNVADAELEAMNRVLEYVKGDVTAMLQKDAEFSSHVESFSVTARVKEPYSMWKKMLRNKHTHILQVPDALALRIVLEAKEQDGESFEVTRGRERALCYYAQKRCQDYVRPLLDNPRLKDYIQNPKQNGYQSLHYTGKTYFEGKDYMIEIQVRSAEMHQVAEFGVASHVDYKLTKNKAVPFQEVRIETDSSSDAYLRKVQEYHRQYGSTKESWKDATPTSFEPLSDAWQSKVRADRIRARMQRLEPYIEALSNAQSDLAREYVFVFLTQSTDEHGKVLALPSGSCVLDAIRESEKTLGCPLRDDNLVLNGAATSVTRQLHNGDVLTLPFCAV
jgi:(p)ppGpp synthase/HD superfamily hydrolase